MCMFNYVCALSGNGLKIRLKMQFPPPPPHVSLTPHSVSPLPLLLSSLFLSLTVGLVLSVPAVGGRYTPATGCAVRGETHTTWHALRATRVRGSCPRERSLAWWRRRSCAGSTTTPWWRTSNGLLRVVSGGFGKCTAMVLCGCPDVCLSVLPNTEVI